MAEDENYRKQYEAIIANAASGISQLKSSLQSSGANVKGFGMQVNDGGTATYFAVLEESSAAQRERIEKKAAEKKAEKKAAEKKAEKKHQKEKLEEARSEKTEKTDVSDKTDTKAIRFLQNPKRRLDRTSTSAVRSGIWEQVQFKAWWRCRQCRTSGRKRKMTSMPERQAS